LAVDPGTRELGVAVLRGDEPLYYGVKSIRKGRLPHEVLGEARDIFARLLREYRPDMLAIEKTFVVQKSAALLSVVADELRGLAERTGLPVREYAPSVVRKSVCRTGRATKRDVARVIAGRYPEFRQYLERTSEWEEKYWANMFDAIAVGLVCLEQLHGDEPDTSL